MNDNKIISVPCKREVEKYLNLWNSLPDYVSQESALDKLFFGDFKYNDNLEKILIKCSVLNDFYSTNIFKIYSVAVHILSLNIDERLREGDPTLVDEIAKITIARKNKCFYSFASKYCSHHNPTAYSIYDSCVEKVLKYFRKINPSFNFNNDELNQYDKFKNIKIN